MSYTAEDFARMLTNTSRWLADEVCLKVIEAPASFPELMKAATASNPKTEMRASRVAWLCAEQAPELFTPYEAEIAQSLPKLSNTSTIRNLLKIFTLRPLPQQEDARLALIDFCLDNILKASQPIGIIGYSIKILENAVKDEPWLAQELYISLEELCEHTTAETLRRQAGKVIKTLS